MVCQLYFNKASLFFKESLGNRILGHFYYSFLCSSESTTEHLEIIPIDLTDHMFALEVK